MEDKSANKQEQRSRVTREKLVVAARALFAERGYAAVGTEEIVRAAGVTRGALYHQFREGKEALFEAVFEVVEAETTQRIAETALASAASPEAALRAGSARSWRSAPSRRSSASRCSTRRRSWAGSAGARSASATASASSPRRSRPASTTARSRPSP